MSINFSGCLIAQVTCGEYKTKSKIMTLKDGSVRNSELFVKTGTVTSTLYKAEAGIGS
jgi:hypothetical protein